MLWAKQAKLLTRWSDITEAYEILRDCHEYMPHLYVEFNVVRCRVQLSTANSFYSHMIGVIHLQL